MAGRTGQEQLHRHLGHRPGLDGLRGVAVLVIVVYHSTVLLKGSSVDLMRWAGGGYLGVDMFFVLSGFLITSLLMQEDERTGRVHVGRFFGRRALRLLPALYFMLLLHLLYVSTTDLPPRPELSAVVSSALYYNNWVGVFHLGNLNFFPPHGAAGLGHLWSLSLEMQFYLIWPFVVVVALSLSRKTSTAVLTLLCILAVLAINRWILWERAGFLNGVYTRTDTRADALVIGALLAVLWLRVDLPRKFAGWLGLGAAVVVAYFIARVHLAEAFLWKGGLTIFDASVAVLLFAILSSNSRLTRVFEWRPLVGIGVVSYGVYLWHQPIYDVVDRYGDHWPTLARVAAAALLTAFFTWVSWQLVERPFLRRKAHLEAPGIESTGPVGNDAGQGDARTLEVPSGATLARLGTVEEAGAP